jgi:hypothetical protein
MTPLSASQKQRCLSAMDELEKFHISRMFSQPVDPVRDNCPTYFRVIQAPMDLGTARRKLEGDQYSSVEQWKSDVDLIWANTITFNGPKSLLAVLARQLQAAFGDITACLSSEPGADWFAKYEKIKADMNALVKSAPKGGPRKPMPARAYSAPPTPRPGHRGPEEASAL